MHSPKVSSVGEKGEELCLLWLGGTSTLGRRAFQQMIQDAQSPKHGFDIIIVYDVKRFGRIDNDEAGYYRYILRTHGVEVRYIPVYK